MSEENKNSEEKAERVSTEESACDLGEENAPLCEETAESDDSENSKELLKETVKEAVREAMRTPPRKEKKKISLTAFVVSSIALILAAVMATYTCCYFAYRHDLAAARQDALSTAEPSLSTEDPYYPFELFSAIMERYALQEVDQEQMMDAALKAYVYATGDRYAAYYNAEDVAVLNAETVGSSVGVGINIIQDETTVGGVNYLVLRVVNIMEGSPALAAGMRLGDMIYAVGLGEKATTINTLGYDLALNELRGEEGSLAEFTVLRPSGEGVETVDFQIARAKVTTTSVRGEAVTYGNRKIGVIKIFQFDMTTPTQFKTEMDRMIAEGCEAFIYDVRYNPGGALSSISAVLSYFLNEGDTLIITQYKGQEAERTTVGEVNYTGDAEGCSVKKEEIGMYRKYPCAVLCNESTASAGELFTATFRDYDIGPVVGTTTYGKGTMQEQFNLFYYGYPGVLKLTVAMYYPASGEGYDGIGIVPDHAVEPSEELKTLNLFEVDLEKDNQLAKALALLSEH